MKTRVLYLSIAAVLAVAPIAGADTFLLSSGGKIEGELKNPDEKPRTTYVVRTSSGGQITLLATAVAEFEQQTPQELQYETMLPAMSDTAEDHWKMAEWCRESGLDEKRSLHLEHVIKHSPDHEKARHGLGYSKVNGRWIITEEYNIQQGLVRHRGGWWLPQDVAIAVHSQNYKEKTGAYRKKLASWRSWFGGKRGAEALVNFQELRDPLAAEPLGEMLAKEQSREVKTLYIDILARLGGSAATTALVRQSIEDNDEIIRDRVLDQLIARKWNGVKRVLRRALKHKEIPKINRAAVGLARMQDTDAIPLLIDALTSKQKLVIGGGGGGGLGSVGAGFGSGGGGMSAGKKPTVLQREVPNESVLNALRHLTGGADFGYNREAWEQWYAQVGTPQNVDLRRRD